MNPGKLRSGLFGFKKSSVYQYISEIEQDYSAKLVQRNDQAARESDEHLRRISQLEAELEEQKHSNEAIKSEKELIALALIDARRYAEAVKKEADDKAAEERKKLEAELDERKAELDRYHEQIVAVREMFQKLLRSMNEHAYSFEQQVKTAGEAAPERNMSLFERKAGSGK